MQRRTALALCIAIATLALFPRAAFAQSQQEAESFVRTTYAKYTAKSSRGPDFTGRNASAVFSPSLVELIRRDQKVARGEVGKLDGDPICDCQDPDGVTLAALHITKESDHNATASVRLHFPSESSPTNLRLHLVWLPQGWRIDDVETKDTPSLRKLLQ